MSKRNRYVILSRGILREAKVAIVDKVESLIERGWKTTLSDSKEWELRVATFLRSAGFPEAAQEFQGLSFEAKRDSQPWPQRQATLLGFLEGLVEAQADKTAMPSQGTMTFVRNASQAVHSKRVFIVHGRDTEPKEQVARFLDRLGLEPIILHEQPSSGQTVIEKFEVHSDVGFAVVLLTPDDVGALAAERTNLSGRARQNVILELGYFIGKLTRRRVCALYKKGVEIPSDYQGVLYVEFDPAGAWRTRLAQELVEAGFSIKLDALLKS